MVEVIGVCRFSYLSSGGWGWSRDNDDMASKARRLFDDARFEWRLKLFREICLPSLKAQTDPDFKFVVLSSAKLPSHHKSNLEHAISEAPQVVVVYGKPDNPRRASLDAMRRVSPLSSGGAQFRLDDDDAVSAQYIETLKRRVRDVSIDRFAVTFPYGVFLCIEPESVRWLVAHYPLSSAGLALATRSTPGKSVYHFAHPRMARLVPTLYDPDGHHFVRTIHFDNDSPGRMHGVDPDADATPVLRKHFGFLNLDAIDALAMTTHTASSEASETSKTSFFGRFGAGRR